MSHNRDEIKTKSGTAVFPLLFCLFCTACVLFFPSVAARSIHRSFERFYARLLPALFPMMILSKRLLNCIPRGKGGVFKRFFRLSDDAFSLFLTGLLCGYPLPAIFSAELYAQKRLSAENAEKCAALFDNASPGFLIAFVGKSILGSVKHGVFLYIAQTLAVLCAMKIFSFAPFETVKRTDTGAKTSLTDDIGRAARTLVEIAAFTAAFSLFADFLCAFFSVLHVPLPVAAVVSGLAEITNGCVLLADGHVPNRVLYLLLPFLSGLGGTSVLFQVRASLPRTLSVRPYILARMLIASLMTACFAVMTHISP